MKNRKLLLIVSLALAMMMSLGGTLAYLTDTDADVNVMTLGNVHIVQNEQERVKNEKGEFTTELKAFTDKQQMLPAVYNVTGQTNPDNNKTVQVGGYTLDKYGMKTWPNYVDKIVTVTNESNTDAYIRTIIAVPAGLNEDSTDGNVSDQWLHFNVASDTDSQPNNGWYYGTSETVGEYPKEGEGKCLVKGVELFNDGKKYDVIAATNKNPIPKDTTTGPNLLGLYLDKAVDYKDGAYYAKNSTGEGAEETVKVWEDTELKVYVLSQAVQATGFSDAWTALHEAFGDVTEENVKTWFTGIESNVETSGDANMPDVSPVEPEIPTEYWSAVAETDWYYDHLDATTYEISTAAQLAGLAKIVNNYEQTDRMDVPFNEKTITLTQNIDLAGRIWTPIGKLDHIWHRFWGTFDGNNKTISNMYVEGTECAGLFGAIAHDGDYGSRTKTEIKNVIVDRATIKATENAAVIVGHSYGDVNNCTVTNSTVTVTDGKAAAIVGTAIGDSGSYSFSNNTVQNVSITGTRATGAIAGRIWESLCTHEENTFSNVKINDVVTDKEFGVIY